MGSSYNSNAEPSSPSSLTLESFFGIKGSVRLVPQGASQKPHIIFRRECPAEYGAESSSVSGKARFSLVANKRFTISKGHTLSFGIVDPKGDDDVKPLNGESTFTLEFDYDDELHSRRDFESLPAKMRKSLTGTKTFDMFAEKQVQNSLGFPGYPLSVPEMRVFASSSVQTDPVEHREISASPLTRTPSPASLTKGRDRYPPRVYPSPISTVDHPTEELLLPADNSTHVKEDELDNDVPTDRSSSPMDLSTPPSLTNSPVILSPPLHGRSSLVPEAQDDNDINTQPVAVGVAGVDLGVPKSCGVQAPDEISSVRNQVSHEDETKKITVAHTHLPTRPVQETSPEKTLTKSQDLNGKPKLCILYRKLPPKPAFPSSTQVSASDFRKSATTREVLPSMPRAMSQRGGLSDSVSSLGLVSSSPTTAAVISPPTVSCTPGNKNGATSTFVPRPPLAPNGFLPHIPSIPTPHPTISNPLGIRPSASMLPKPPPTGPKSLLGSTTTTVNVSTQPPTSNGATTARTLETLPTRKPVVVSASWSALRGSAPLGNVNPTSTPSHSSGSRSIPTVTKTTTPEEAISSNPNLSVLLRYSASPPRGMPSILDSTNTEPLPELVRPTTSAKVQASELSVDADAGKDIVQDVSPDTKGKWKRIAEEGCPRSLKRPRREARQGKEPVASNVTKGDPQQPRKRLKNEASGQGETSLVRSSSTGTNSNIDMSVDKTLRQSKVDGNSLYDGCHSRPLPVKTPPSTTRRESRKKLKTLNSVSLYGEQETTGNEKSGKGEAEEGNMGQIASKISAKGKEEREVAEKVAKERAGKLNEADSRISSAPSPLAQKYPQPPRLTHPLPPKPQIPMTASSYRPQMKRERERSRGPDHRRSRSRSRSRNRASPSRSRSRGRGRGRTRERSSSRSSRRDPSIDDKRTQVPEPLSTQGRDVTQVVMEALSQEPINTSDATWPMTTPIMVHQIQGARPIAVRQILFASDGKRVGIVCSDKTVRLWDTKPRIAEAAKLLHNAHIVTVSWMEYDKGVLTLCDDGSVNTWLLQGKEWQHTRLFQLQSPSSSGPVAMAYGKDRIAVSTTSCVKVWLLYRGVWQPQREIKRSGVTALCFHLDGGLFGGCQDGTLWYCEVPNGTLRAYYLIADHWMITSIDIHPNGVHLLAGQKGASYLITHEPNAIKGKLDKFYVTPGSLPSSGNEAGDYSSIFATNGQAVVSGLIKGCALVWDRKKGNIVYGLRHPHDDNVQAIASFDGQPGVEGMMVSGTKNGRLFWWPIPQAAPTGSGRYPSCIPSNESGNPH